MAKRLTPKQEPPSNLLKEANTKIITDAIKEIENLQAGAASAEVLRGLTETLAGKPWFKLEQPAEYTFAEKLFENRRWLMPMRSGHEPQNAYPPGTTFLGIVLDRTLEVSVVEELPTIALSNTTSCQRQYHRPMAILPKGSLFGTFETADLMCQTQPIQNYTVFSGLRTFFFSEPKLDPQVLGNKPYHKELKELSDFDITYDPGTSASRTQRRASPENTLDLDRWKKSSPTESPLLLLEAVLGKKLRDWKSKVLVIPIGSEFLAHVSPALKELIWRNAWHQSEHLRRQAIESYSTDRVVQLLNRAHKHFRSAIARELKTVPALLTESRPGFRELTENAGSFGPFPEFFSDLQAGVTHRKSLVNKETQSLLNTELKSGTYIPQFLYDHKSELIFPLWPNFDPLCPNLTKHTGPGLLTRVSRSWSELQSELFTGDWAYSKDSVKLERDPGAIGRVISILRGPVRIQNTTPRLPLFEVVKNHSATLPFAAIIAVQHLMEETLCLVQEIIDRKLAEKQNIFLLGKPYSSSVRIAHRIRQLGAKAEIPNTTGWESGTFDSCFDAEVKGFLAKVLTAVPTDPSKPVLLLDDGGALMKAASAVKWKGGFRAVEQTSRGIASTLDAKFPVVLVACSALKYLVEPEFVARAAVNKLALHYPEALRSEKVGIIGLGSVGGYFADYVINRRDIHHGARVFGFDPAPSQKPNSTTDFCRCGSAADVFRQADVVYGCSGEDLGLEADKHGASGQLLISLSSGDIEFASLLRKGKKPAAPMLPVDTGRAIIANSGYPITFDGAPSSAPLVEMQVTRALLLAAIQQSLSESTPGHRILDAQLQWDVWDKWNNQILQPNGDPSFTAWREQRRVELESTDLFDISPRVGDKTTFTKKNEEFFSKAVKRAKERSASQRARSSSGPCPPTAIRTTSKRHFSTG